MKLQRNGLEFGLIGLLWVLLLTLTPLGVDIAWPTEFWIRQVFLAFVLTGAYYFNTVFLLPKYLNDNQFIRYGIIIISLILGMMLLMDFFEQQIELPRRMHELFRPERPFTPRGFRFSLDEFTMMILNFSVGIIVFLIRKGQLESERRKELEKLQVSTELSYLKAQINPHFFFNTLNNIYALTTIDIEASRKAILTLSSMMRYVIYEGKSKYAPLTAEIKFVDNYLELMKLRLPERVQVNYSKPQAADTEKIAPMVLLPFIENAFKHGISGTKPSEITISLSSSNSVLELYVKNTIFPKPQVETEEHGIGIANTRRRLELLYPGRHELNINDEDGTFEVSLRIEL